ncbi:hypothetical protein [Streptomyces sp. bgisy130]|uniref:hypothetical protein n=1 Tax=Streptomyces sp. bgisy130 TaxID=3413788 RepID=UPI003F4A0E6A
MTTAVANRLVTAWAAEGDRAAVLTINDGDVDFSWYHSGDGAWLTVDVPRPTGHVMRWNRLRLTPGNGEAWRVSLNPGPGLFAVVDDEAI